MKTKGFPPFEIMEENGAILHEALAIAESLSIPGVSTHKIDCVVEEYIRSKDAYPAFKGYDGFPACCCISVNNSVVHGAPTKYKLKPGDIVSVDCGVLKNSAYTDAARTFAVGSVSEEDEFLIWVTREALNSGIASAMAGNRIGEISYAVQKCVESNGLNVSRQFVGHSIGYDLHMAPWVPNFGRKSSGEVLCPGMYLAVEPIVFSGSWKTTQKSEWDIITRDGKNSAHFEETIYIGDEDTIVIT